MKKIFPLSLARTEQLASQFGTPFYIYDEKAIRANIRKFIKAFSIFPDFTEFFAVKALPNPYILKILASEGCGADCSSLPELILAERAGITGEQVMFTSNNTPEKEFVYANMKGNILNLDDITHIEFVEKACGNLPDYISFRYNPGPLKQSGVNAFIGKPEEAKYGLTREQIFEAYKICKEKGVSRFALHTMVASNELNLDYFVETARILFELARDIKEKVGVSVEMINLGGGLGIPYKLDQKPVDYDYVAKEIRKVYDEIIVPSGLDPVKICWECGRPITGPYGYLVTRAIHEKHIYREYIGVDASMADLMRPGMYGAYHHVTVCGKDEVVDEKGEIIPGANVHIYDIVGSLCENCDKFAVQRPMPKIDKGDLLVIHDAGAHSRAMGFNYNAKLRCKELLLREDGSVMQIRRAETVDDYFATLDFEALRNFS
ncbi:MAG: diaminopimelate decarboxylase [Treponema sp.]|nr:diaminopimelate decarboxylase [Treponema sp.]